MCSQITYYNTQFIKKKKITHNIRSISLLVSLTSNKDRTLEMSFPSKYYPLKKSFFFYSGLAINNLNTLSKLVFSVCFNETSYNLSSIDLFFYAKRSFSS